jgi:hypothetical protein
MTSPNHQLLRPIVEADWPELAKFDLGSANTPWVREVAEIVEMLPRWQADISFTAFERKALALVENGQIVAVAAHEATQTARGTIDLRNRYLMVVAVRFDRQRNGLAELVMKSVFVSLEASGTESVKWLAHPRNVQSVAVSRSKFPEADETNPPEDQPYVAFTLWF